MDLSKISDHDLRSELYRREEKKIREKWLTFPKDVKPYKSGFLDPLF